MSRREVGSIRELSPGVYRVEVSVGYSHASGKRRRPTKVVRGSDRDAEIALARLLLEAGKLPETEVTVRQFLEGMYLPHVEGRRRARTVDGYRSIIEHHIVEDLGDTYLTDLTPYQLDRWMDGLKRTDDDPLSDESRLHVYRCLHAALGLAVRWRLLETNPLKAVEAPTVERFQRKDVLDAKEVVGYLAAFAGHELEPILVMALGCGLRRSELAGLLWSDFDFDAGTVTIARGLHDHKGGVIEEKPKSQTSRRTIAVPAWALDALKPLRGIGPLVPEDGQPMRPGHISAEYARRIRAAKLRYVPLKNLRHSHAMMMLDAGVDLYAVSRRLGHSTVAVTQLHYVDPSAKVDRAAADAAGDVRQLAPSAIERQQEDGKRSTTSE